MYYEAIDFFKEKYNLVDDQQAINKINKVATRYIPLMTRRCSPMLRRNSSTSTI